MGGFFLCTRIPFITTICFIHSWCEESTSLDWCEKKCGVSQRVTFDCSNFMRYICVDYLKFEQDKRIEEGDTIVEIHYDRNYQTKSYQQQMTIM